MMTPLLGSSFGGVIVALAAFVTIGATGGDTMRYLSPVDIAVSADGSRIFVVCERSGEVLAADASTGKIQARVAVGSVPRAIALSPDGGRAYVTNSWSDTVSEIDVAASRITRTLRTGFEPEGIAIAGRKLFVPNRMSNDVSVIDIDTGLESQRLSAGRGASFIAAARDGSHVVVSHIYPNLGPERSTPQTELTTIDTARAIVTDRTTVANAGHLFSIAISQDGKLGIAAALRPKNLIPLAHVARGWGFVDALVVWGQDTGGRVLQMPLDEIERYASQPWGVAISPDKSQAFVSAAGSDEVIAIDLPNLLTTPPDPNDLSLSARYVTARIPVGSNPRGIALSPDGSLLYVTNRLDDSISVIDTHRRAVTQTYRLGGSERLTPERRGERLFNASRFSHHGQFGCANCHIDATMDGLTWDLEPDGFGIDIVDNKLIEDVAETAPFKWNAGNPDLETECGPRTEMFFYRTQSFDQQELADLVLYLKSIPLRPNRYRRPDGELTPAQERGKALFERTTTNDGRPISEVNQCPVCHSGSRYSNLLVADVGSGKPKDRSPLVDTPHLTGIANSAPYMHDGSARTLEEIWTVQNPGDTHGFTSDLTKDELNDLIEYLKTL